MELTPEDTLKDLQNLLINAIPGFEFPRKNLYDYTIEVREIPENELIPDDFVLGVVWGNLSNDLSEIPIVLVDKSRFNCELTQEEINVIATYMVVEWLGQQLASVENTRMKYSGSDFKFTSQANHMAKILTLKQDYEREGFHLQRLYKRRKRDENGIMSSTFDSIMSGSVN